MMVALQRLNLVFAATSWLANFIIIAALVAVGYYAADREPPFAILSVEPASAKPGEVVRIHMQVRRDTQRKCSAQFSRYLFDSQHVRYFLDSAQASAAMIDSLEERQPGRLAVAFVVPATATPGPARMVSALEYTCNRVHAWGWPIEVTTEAPFTILEP